jgi:predicted MPP superfamily phosphohydrolase
MLVEALKFDGLEMLINSSAIIRRGDEHIRLVGVDDAYSQLDDVDAAFEGVCDNEFVVFLTHSPCAAPKGIEKGADLILAGHTHGGQVRFPFLGVIFTHTRSHKALNDGLYTSDRLAKLLKTDPGRAILFVSRGIGTSRLHIRLLCPPEIVYITLHRG